jgi:ABC-type Fe3+ transport system permease subunit
MVHDRLVQPRQIYASTLTRRDRRWARRRVRSPLGFAVVSAATLLVALSVLAILVPGVA